ncbi:coniferyl-alcohol dehydrogenase [Roseibium algae]|uniref:Coniferyl-alcohol dehydrogenase n=1 Tax=Roseibium algae TaxID=3123038 RepID=A0ABU8TGI7_9HYPH
MAMTKWAGGKLLQDKTIVVTGCASGIGWETARLVKKLGGDVLGIDVHKTEDHVDELYIADLGDRMSIKALVNALPSGIDGIANIAGLPPTAPAEKVLAVNLVGLKFFTHAMIGKLNDGASIVNLASLAGFGWPETVSTTKAAENLSFEDIADFVGKHDVSSKGGRSYFFSKEALIVWTLQNRWTWRDRNIRMNAVSPGPVDTPILKDFIETLGARAEEDMKTMDRPGHAEDIAPVVAFLLSDMTHWIRGTNIPVDGGMSSHILANMHQL